MKGLESPVKKRARLSLKKRESEPPSSSSSSPRNSCISSSNALSPSSSSSLSLLSHSPASSNVSHSASNATNSLAAFSNVNTATLPPPLPPSVTPSATITTCASSASGLLTTTTTTTTTTTSVSVTSTSEENSTAAAAARKIDSSSSSSSSHASSSSLPRLKEADNFLESETNHDVISINSDDVYESMPIVAALENLDNTCFLNSVLQILRYTPKFVHGLDELCYKVSNAKKGKQLENSRSVNEDVNMSCQVWEMTLAISEMFKQMNALEKKMQAMSNVSSTHIALKPDKLQHVVRKLNSMFEGSAQHDAQEFLQFILYHLQEAEKQMKKCQQEARSENTNGGGGGRRRMAGNASPGSAGTNLDNGNNNNNNNNNNCLNTTSGPSSLNVVNPVSSTYTTNLITSTTILSTTTTTTTTTSSSAAAASLSASSSLSSSNNALSATNEPVSLPINSDKSSISEVNSMNPETRCTSFLKTSGPNSLQNPSSDISTSLPQTRHNSSPGKESINIVNSNSTTTAVTTMTPTPWLSPLSAELSASSAETPNTTRDSYATHNGNHEGKPNGIVSALTSETEHCYLKQKVANGEMDSCALSPTANAPLSKHTFSSSATSPVSSKTVSGGPPRHSLPYDTSLFLTNGMSKNQVNQIKNSVVRLENCDQVCNSLQQSVNAYYAIECLSAGRTLNGKRKDFVEQLFLGTILSRTRCLECEKASEKHEEFLEVSVPLKKAATSHPKNSDGEGSDLENEDHSDRNTLISFISSFSEVEKLQGDNKYYCDSCCNYVEADRSLHYETLPDILTVHLKRFSASSELGLMCKINDHVDVPLSLPCLLYKCHKNCCRQDHRYTLFGIITHAGYTISSGHYVAYVKTSASALTWHFPLNPNNNNNNNSSAGGGGLSSSGEVAALASNVEAYPNPVGLDSPPQQDDDIFWLECDDSSVRVFTEEDFLERLSSEGLLTGTPYLLFYHKTPMGRSF